MTQPFCLRSRASRYISNNPSKGSDDASKVWVNPLDVFDRCLKVLPGGIGNMGLAVDEKVTCGQTEPDPVAQFPMGRGQHVTPLTNRERRVRCQLPLES